MYPVLIDLNFINDCISKMKLLILIRKTSFVGSDYLINLSNKFLIVGY